VQHGTLWATVELGAASISDNDTGSVRLTGTLTPMNASRAFTEQAAKHLTVDQAAA